MRRRHGGAVAVLAAATLLLAIAALALAVDVGRLYLGQRDLQRIANLAAMDAARVATECLGPVEDRLAAAQAEALRSVLTNGGSADYLEASSVALGAEAVDGDGTRYFEPTADEQAYAVRVRLSTPTPARLLPALTGDAAGRTMAATASAKSERVASLSVSGRIANLNPSLTLVPYGAPLDPGLNVTLGSYQSFLDVSVKLDDLSAGLGFAQTDEFLVTEISGVNLFDALLDFTEGTVRNAIATIAGAMDGTAQIVPGDLIGVEPGWEDPAEDTLVNVGALVLGTLERTVGDRGIEVTIPPLLGLLGTPGTVRASQYTSTRTATGPAGRKSGGEPRTVAHTSAGYVQVELPGVNVAGLSLNLKMFADGGEAAAWPERIDCARMGVPQPVVEVRARSDAVRVGIGEFDDINGANPTPRPTTILELPTVLGFNIKVGAYAVTRVAGNDDVVLYYTGHFQDAPQRQSFGTPPGATLGGVYNDLAGSVELTIDPPVAESNPLTRLTVQQLRATLPGLIAQALQSLSADAIEPALLLGGVAVGGGEVAVSDVKGGPPQLFAR